MIHSVPIYSLPQDWLWCETWCSDESKEHAKTIDLVRPYPSLVPTVEQRRKGTSTACACSPPLLLPCPCARTC